MSFSHPMAGGALACTVGLVFLAPALGQGPPTRVLPIGDSITAGALGGPNGDLHGRGGYRYFLERFLEGSDGFESFEIIGSNPGNGGTLASFAGKWYSPESPAERPLKYQGHSGYPGFTIEQIAGLVADNTIPVASSDVILLQAGTNNVGYGSAVPATAGEIAGWRSAYEALIDAILAKSGTVRVVMARIPPVAGGSNLGNAAANAARIAPFNGQVVAAVHAGRAAAHPGRFFLVDNFGPLDPANQAIDFSTATNAQDYFTGLGDGVHPYNAGHRKMAVNFWNGYQLARGKAATALVTPLDDPDGDGTGGADVCLIGDGSRRLGAGGDVSGQPYVLASTHSHKRAKFFIRLDLSGLPKHWDEARFNLIFWGAPQGSPNFSNCCDDQPVSSVFQVHGVADGADGWTEEGVQWATAPGNVPGGNGIVGTLLGELVVPAGAMSGDVVSLSTPALRDFVNLARGSDGMITLAITGTALDPGFRVSFQDSDFRDYAPAFLQLARFTAVPASTDFRIVSNGFAASPSPSASLTFTSAAGGSYLVSASSDLATFDEVLLAGIAGANGTTTVTVPLPSGRERLFLRVERQ